VALLTQEVLAMLQRYQLLLFGPLNGSGGRFHLRTLQKANLDEARRAATDLLSEEPRGQVRCDRLTLREDGQLDEARLVGFYRRRADGVVVGHFD
jgi:hypothetical protein